MDAPIVDQVVDFFDTLFNSVFSEPFQARIAQPLRRRAVVRQIQEAADAASQSLTRFLREVALAMQSDDRAEYEAYKVQDIFVDVLGDEDRAEKLLTHIRRRTGLLLERRPDVFAFAHLTFHEYLAALAVHEGSQTEATKHEHQNQNLSSL